ncbi:helix-turn-helix domain-containing protein [Actinospica sp. MGRD01-02]|uniref:Helix-turn-helix domain-containing protein n=1 Tax=Actinospica acidithermotolerans TaxID=2828514 RepID=A0A941EGW3_9ACTN|nr:PucR family transcriptional regulator [Actinospica acidithermotolerans]MBR7828849.1 helix-turn-helix domain-containing protein [Actinospica acidithermotolerans]
MDDVARLGSELLGRADQLADAMAEQIRKAVPVYQTDTVNPEDLRAACLDNVLLIFSPMAGRSARPALSSRQYGRARAQAGLPLAAVMDAYRVAARYLWDELALAAARTEVGTHAALAAASEMWRVLDEYTAAMSEGYREEITSQVLVREQERSALVQALIQGRLAETSIWDAAEILRLPRKGPYAVVLASATETGRHPLPRIEHDLKDLGITSAWRLEHDVYVGVANLKSNRPRFDDLVAKIESATTGRVGISPQYQDLRETPDAHRLARIAQHSAYEGHRVVVFDRHPLAIAAATAPEVGARLAHTTLEGLDSLPVADRELLLTTLGAWLDAGGSADQAASRLFVHPNTIRHRLRRLEERTGRSLTDPRSLAELTLAFEADRRLGN